MKRLLVVMALMLASSAQADVYKWIDGRGVAHYTNKEYEIPARYKARAKPLHIEAVQAGAPAAPATAPPQQATPTQPPAQPQDKPVSPQVAPPNPGPQPVVTPAGTPPAQSVPIRPRVRRRIHSGDE
ncbi:DUF4124 domain-containing protein [Oryzomonas japonica]|uniref:DUF4124 domain-containing protein n=1 Tax=Oryzomonas japonica TaxID=2603858 RepID=A0A7J4ZM03_9BACT|nr:DUF4124 domain-containing protein [Oryzomonas japonica]KAB0663626.1 DUF4124 domain-containing protein [Oryzomonas japonica]